MHVATTSSTAIDKLNCYSLQLFTTVLTNKLVISTINFSQWDNHSIWWSKLYKWNILVSLALQMI